MLVDISLAAARRLGYQNLMEESPFSTKTMNSEKCIFFCRFASIHGLAPSATLSSIPCLKPCRMMWSLALTQLVTIKSCSVFGIELPSLINKCCCLSGCSERLIQRISKVSIISIINCQLIVEAEMAPAKIRSFAISNVESALGSFKNDFHAIR